MIRQKKTKIKKDITTESNNKYLTRCHYYGKLVDILDVSGADVLILKCYTATEFFAGDITLRIYVPTNIANKIIPELELNTNYFIIAAPYRACYNKDFKYRVDMLLNIFSEVT